MKTSDFDYELPEDCIAQTPANPRDESRLLVYNRATGVVEHRRFRDILEYLRAGDVVVINSTRVSRARVFGLRGTTRVEIFLLKQIENLTYEVLLRPAKRIKIGDTVTVADGVVGTCVSKDADDGTAVVNFTADPEPFGETPLPPYIKTGADEETAERYQTVYAHAEKDGSCAAPTAGLHWTPELMARAHGKGVIFCEIVLTVGLGTFRAVKTENLSEHKMHAEHYVIPKKTAEIITRAKKDGRRVICVGTTSVRTIESVGEITACSGETDIFIYPPYKFRVVDAMITNFHLPKSTLLMLISAFIGREKALEIYADAVKNGYRFFSFGDACFFM